MGNAVQPYQAETSLAKWEAAAASMRQQIAEARTAQECLRLSDAAEALLACLKIAGALIKDQNRVARMKVESEWKAGDFLRKMSKAPPGRKPQNRGHDDPNLNGHSVLTYGDMAARLGISKQSFKLKAKRVLTIRVVPARPFIAELDRLEAGDLLITSQYFFQLGRRRRDKAVREAAAAEVDAPHGLVRLGDFRKSLVDVPDRSVSLIFTDPPYGKDAIPLYAELAKVAARVLIYGGSLVCYAGQYALPLVFPLMTPHLHYQWAFAVRHSGGHRRQHGWKVRVAWKPLLWFVKGRYKGDYVLDLLDSSPGDKSLHDWAQGCGEAAYLIDKLCPEGGLVLDPMCGSGTTLLAAKRLKRRFLGVEIDPKRRRVAAKNVTSTEG